MPLSTPPQAFSWTSDEGNCVIKEIVEEIIPQWTDGPRPAQVDCWAHSLAGRPTILIASTGWGKTTAFFVPILILQHLAKFPRRQIPKPPTHPIALVVTPLIELGNAHSIEISEYGLKAISLTAESLLDASKEGRSLLREVCEGKWSVVLLSAERLVSPEVDVVLRDETFRRNLVLLGIDETHVLVPWGKDFRQAYRQISALRHRLPSHTALVAVSATISPGREFDSLCSELGLKAGQFHTIRESSEWPNVRMIFKPLTHGLGGFQFPDIAWVFRRGIKAVIYCRTIDLCFRVAYYGWNLFPEGRRRLDNVRLWTSITSSQYNNRTLDLFKSNEDTSVIVATIAFGMGMNLRNISDSINLGLPTTYSGLIQQNGRAGRNLELEARGWTYVEGSVCAALADDSPGSSKRVDDMDQNLQDMVKSHVRSICLIATANRLSGNPGEDALLTCAQAKRRLWCSSCQPYPSPHATLPDPPSRSQPQISFTTPHTQTAPTAAPLSKKARINLDSWLTDFAIERWSLKDDPCESFLPYPAIWHGISQEHILDNFHLMLDRESVNSICKDWKYLSSDGDSLFDLLQKLRRALEEATRKQKEERARKAAATRAKNKAIAAKDKENTLPATTLPSASSSLKLTIRIPGRSAINAELAAELATWEPPPVETAFDDLLRKRPIALGPLDINTDLSAKRHRASHQS